MLAIFQKALSKLAKPHSTGTKDDRQNSLRDALQKLEYEVLLILMQNPSSSLPGRTCGTWKCDKCTHTNDLVVLPGEHPLGYMTCAECHHVICPTCMISPLIEPWYTFGSDLRKDPDDSGATANLPIAHICRDCGLSWRAVVTKVAKVYGKADMVHWGSVDECVCGSRPRPWKTWYAYLVGGGKPSSWH
ncbi:Nn.00g097320.m01.CDS01 [Neocucurbitaria sp. VM-36]